MLSYSRLASSDELVSRASHNGPNCLGGQERQGDDIMASSEFGVPNRERKTSPARVTITQKADMSGSNLLKASGLSTRKDSDSKPDGNDCMHLHPLGRTRDFDISFVSSRDISSEFCDMQLSGTISTQDHWRVFAAERKLKKLLHSRRDKTDVALDFAAKRHLIVCDDSHLKLIEMSKELQDRSKCNRKSIAISPKSFDQVSKI